MTEAASSERQIQSTDAVGRARDLVTRRAGELDRADLVDDAALVASELVTNALLHGGGCRGVDVLAIEDGLRIEVRDASPVRPMPGLPSDASLTGRGLRLIAGIAAGWGAEIEADGKVLWADVTRGHARALGADVEELLGAWSVDLGEDAEPAERLFHIELGGVPTDLLLEAKAHVDNLVREFTLAASGAQAGQTAALPPHLGSLVTDVIEHFADIRLAIKRQALLAAGRGEQVTQLVLDLPARAADAAEEYVRALDEVDAYSRARRLLTLETPPQHRVFRRWYVEELVTQLRAAVAGTPAPPAQPFERRLLIEIDEAAAAHRGAERAARLYTVAAALATALTPEAVASAVLTEGVAALGAAGGSVLLATGADALSLPGTLGYDEDVVARLRHESIGAELPAAMALRTGEPVWMETPAESAARFPQLSELEATTVALCAVPLEVDGRRLGALRFSFTGARLFDEAERRFVLTLAAQTAQALDRAQLHQARVDISRRLQRSLLPPRVPTIPGLDAAVIYRAFGDGIEVGGDFYDLWAVDNGRWAIAVGDVAGTGPEAAALTALARHTLRALTINTADPGEIMGILNRLLQAGAGDDNERFCTALFGFVLAGDPIEVWLASGGHPAPMLRRADGSTLVEAVGGSLLGVFPDAAVETRRLRLEPGDTLVLVTDGVLEAKSAGVEFGVEGVMGVLATELDGAAAVAAGINEAVRAHTGGTLSDDMVVLVLQVPRPPA